MKRPDTTEYYPSEAGKEWQAYAEYLEKLLGFWWDEAIEEVVTCSEDYCYCQLSGMAQQKGMVAEVLGIKEE